MKCCQVVILSVLNMIPGNGKVQDGLVMFSIKSKHREVAFFNVVNDFFPLVFSFFFFFLIAPLPALPKSSTA